MIKRIMNNRTISLGLGLIIVFLFNCSVNSEKKSKTYSISGYIEDNISEGIRGVTLVLSGDKSAAGRTDIGGFYQFTGLSSGTYVITPQKDEYVFKEQNRSYIPLSDSQSNQNFLGSKGVIIYEVEPNEIGNGWASIVWKTNILSTSRVEYGTTLEYGSKSGKKSDEKLVVEHYIRLFDLTKNTTYHFRVISSSEIGRKKFYSADYVFTAVPSKANLFDKLKTICYPNPCKSRTNFYYYLYQTVDSVTITVYTLSGKEIVVLESESLNEGKNELYWDVKDNSGNDVPEGLYIYQVKVKKGKLQDKVKKPNLMVVRILGEPGKCGTKE